MLLFLGSPLAMLVHRRNQVKFSCLNQGPYHQFKELGVFILKIVDNSERC